MKQHRLEIAIALALVAGTLLTYWPALGNGFVNYDDADYAYKNFDVMKVGLTWPGVRWAFTTTHAANWHPLTWLSLQLDASLFGPGPFGFHLTNLLLHAANAVLLFVFLRLATGRPWPSALVAALFALHPLHVESVAWVAERKDVLSTFFWMLTLLAYLGYVRRPGALRYAAVAAALALGLMAKPMLVTLPCVLLLLDGWPLHRAKRPTDLVREKLPLFGLAAVSCAVTLYAQHAGHTIVTLTDVGPLERVGNALVAYVVYLRMAVWPADLAVFYPHPRQQPALHVAGAVLVLVLVTGSCLWARRSRPYLAVGWLWYLGTLVPVIGLVQVGIQAWADRYTYVPLIGVFLMAAWGAADLAARDVRARYAVTALGLAVLAACAVGTRLQLAYWRDGGELWRHVIAVTAPHEQAHRFLGLYLVETGQLKEALPHLEEAVRLAPASGPAQRDLAAVLARSERLKEAEPHYREAVRLDPNLLLAWTGLAMLEARQRHWQEAEEHLGEVFRRDPDNALAHFHYGKLLEKLGRVPAALDEYRAALRAEPRMDRAHYRLGTQLGRQGKFDEAIAHLREAVRLAPGHAEAHENLGHAYEGKGEHEQAVGCYRQAVRLGPKNAHARLSLAAALRRQGNTAEAREEYRAALRLDPTWPAGYGRAAWALATHPDPRKRDPREAVALAEEACLATENARPELLDALAAAYAAAGRFNEAAAAARRALQVARAGNRRALVAPLEQRLELYKAHRPFCDPSLN